MQDDAIIIAGGGIAGLVMGLTLHQLGLPFHVVERVRSPKPLGVGINLQPPAVRELTEMGLADLLDDVGLPTRDYGFYTRTGTGIWTEPRGLHAGYLWPQYSVHRGRLQMALLDALVERAGPGSVSFGQRVTGYETGEGGITVSVETDTGRRDLRGRLLIGADGIHSAVRAQMYPEEGAPVWGGAIMWRATTQAVPFLSGASMVLIGNDSIRFVAYPISAPDPETGRATINWIAEKRVDPSTEVAKEDWNRETGSEAFLSDFEDWRFDWIDVPDLIRGAETIYEYPMVDREPVDTWVDGRAVLIGDAAHATYPVGSSGASQAIIDARTLGARIFETGAGPAAASSYAEAIRPMANAVTLGNRAGGGPDAVMQLAEDRCGGDFARLDEAFPMAERAALALGFKERAGLTVEGLNARPSIIVPA